MKPLNYCLFVCALSLSVSKGFSQGQQPVSNTPPPTTPPDREMQNNDDPNRRMPGRPDLHEGNPKAQLDSKKNMFIIKRLQLTPEESAKFLPLYQKYNQELNQLKMQSRIPLIKAMQDERDSTKKISAKDQNKLIDNEMLLKEQEIELAKKYNEEYKKIMPPMKVAKLCQAEDQFIEAQLNSSIRMEDRNSRRPFDRPMPPNQQPAGPLVK